jgi:hypothetical protein
MIDGRRERVRAKTTPNPTALTSRVASIATLYAFGIKY